MAEILKNFYILEGLDGAGTTTQLEMINIFLNQKNIKHFITREPTSNPTGLLIRQFLSGKEKVSQSTIARAFSTDRDDHIYNPLYGIIKHLNNGELVISDRYLFSSIAYQSIGYNKDEVIKMNNTFPLPQTVFYIDTPIDCCLERIKKRGNEREIYEEENYLKSVRSNYEKCFLYYENEIELVKIDGTKSINEIQKIIQKIILKYMNISQ